MSAQPDLIGQLHNPSEPLRRLLASAATLP